MSDERKQGMAEELVAQLVGLGILNGTMEVLRCEPNHTASGVFLVHCSTRGVSAGLAQSKSVSTAVVVEGEDGRVATVIIVPTPFLKSLVHAAYAGGRTCYLEDRPDMTMAMVRLSDLLPKPSWGAL